MLIKEFCISVDDDNDDDGCGDTTYYFQRIHFFINARKCVQFLLNCPLVCSDIYEPFVVVFNYLALRSKAMTLFFMRLTCRNRKTLSFPGENVSTSL